MGWTRPEITLALMLATFSMAAMSPLAGRLIDQGKGPHLMAMSCVGAAVCIASLSQVSTLFWFYALWIANGAMLAGCLYEPCFALITRIFGSNAKKSITAVTLIAGFASTLSFPAAHIISNRYSWQITALVFATVVAGAAAPLLWVGAKRLESGFTQTPVSDNSQSASQTSSSRFLKSPVFWFIAVGFALAAVVHGAALHHLLPLLAERGIAAGVAVTAVSFIGPMQVSGRILIAVLGERLSNHKTVFVIFAAMAASVICLLGAKWLPFLLFFFVPLFGGGYGMLSIIRPVIAREALGGESFGAKSGALAFIYLLGSGSAPWLGSLLWRVGGYSLLLISLLFMTLLATLLYLASSKAKPA